MIDDVVLQLRGFFLCTQGFGDLNYFLNMAVKQTPVGLQLSQQKYITELLDKVLMFNAKSLLTPMAACTSLSAHIGALFEYPNLYRKIVGAL